MAIVCEFDAESVKSRVTEGLLNCLAELRLAMDGGSGVLIVNKIRPNDPLWWIAATNGWIALAAPARTELAPSDSSH